MKPLSGFAVAFALTLGGVFSAASFANAQANALSWKRDPSQAMTQARQLHKGVLAFFHDASSQDSSRLLITLSESKVCGEIESSFIPLMVDTALQKSLAVQLGVKQPGVVVLYSDSGQALAMLQQKDAVSAEELTARLHAIASEHGLASSSSSSAAPGLTPAAAPTATPETAAAAPALSPTPAGTPPSLSSLPPGALAIAKAGSKDSPSVASQDAKEPPALAAAGSATPPSLPAAESLTPASPAVAASTPLAPAEETSPQASFVPFAGSVAPDDLVRDQLGNQVSVSGPIMVFEPSTAQNRPFIISLSKRAQDALQIVYWPQTAEQVHAGRRLPREGDRVSVQGKLTDYRGKLQIKVEKPDQIRYSPKP